MVSPVLEGAMAGSSSQVTYAAAAKYQVGEPDSWRARVAELRVKRGPRIGLGWSGRARSTWERQQYERRVIEGKCPRCGHRMTKDVTVDPKNLKETFRDTGGKLTKDDDPYDHYFLVCNCVHFHEGAPTGTSGCGAQGGARVRHFPPDRQPKDQAVEYEEMSVEERDANAWVEQARHDDLVQVRQFAGQWQTTITAVIGLVSVGTIIGADDAIHKLQYGWAVAYFIFGGLALIAAVASVVYASESAGLRRVHVSADIRDRLMLHRSLVAYSLHKLMISKGLALTAVVLLAISLVLRYFGHQIA